jgi:hypothetical protein
MFKHDKVMEISKTEGGATVFILPPPNPSRGKQKHEKETLTENVL